jgi:hypothetical protein
MIVSVNIYRDDTSQSVADRVFRHHFSTTLTSATKEKRHHLAQVIEREVNRFIFDFKD